MAARRRKHEDDHVCPAVEAYLLTYSDMITALLIFFIVLFAMGQLDLAKFERFKNGIAQSGATPIDDGMLENGEGIFEQAIIRPDIISSPDDNDGPGGIEGQPHIGGDTDEQFAATQAQITDALADFDIGTEIRFRQETRGLVITIVSDQVLFHPGQATLTEDGHRIIDAIGDSLVKLDNVLTVEGHTDSVPINTARFPSNWELSVARSTTVLRSLVEDHGVAAYRTSAAGYADQRPIATNETAEGRAANRRVEIVIHNSSVVTTAGFTTTGTPATGEEG